MQVCDPVCGMQFEEEQSATTVQYKGRTYYFCAEHCKTLFEKDPERYVEREGEV